MVIPYTEVLRNAVLRQRGIRTLVLDLADIIAVDAAGLGMLASLRAWAKETRTELKLMNVTPRVEKLLELTNLKSAFEVCSGREMLALLCRAINETNPVESGFIPAPSAGVLQNFRSFLKSVEWVPSHPSYVQAHNGADNRSQRRKSNAICPANL
jgi:anti-anti-sigma factor